MVKKMEHHEHPASETPDLNFCPRCSHALEEREAFGRIRRYCPACERVIFREHKVAAAMLLTDAEGRVLLARRAWQPLQGAWSLPAGFVDYDEDPAAAAVRECYEETGLRTEVAGLLDLIAGREHPHGADIVVVYRGRLLGGELRAADDASDARFFPLDSLPPLAFRATEAAIERWRSLRTTGDDGDE